MDNHAVYSSTLRGVSIDCGRHGIAFERSRSADDSARNLVGNLFGAVNRGHNQRAGVVTNGYGAQNNYIQSSAAGVTTNAYANLNKLDVDGGTVTTGYVNYSWVEVDGGTLTTVYGDYNRLDRDAGTAGTGYLYYGVYEGTWGTKYGIVLSGETDNSLSGNLAVGTTITKATRPVPSITLAQSAPTTSLQNGDLWWDRDNGNLYLYYQDSDTNQWVEASPGTLGNGVVQTAMLADDAVTYTKMQNIVTANRVLGSTTAGGVVSEVQVQTDMIATDAVTSAKLASLVTLIIYNSAGTALKTLYGAGA